MKAVKRLDLALERIKGDFDFSGDGVNRPDREKLDWAESEAEIDEIWGKRLTYEVAYEVLNQVDLNEEKKSDQNATEGEDKEPDLSEEEQFAKYVKEARKSSPLVTNAGGRASSTSILPTCKRPTSPPSPKCSTPTLPS